MPRTIPASLAALTLTILAPVARAAEEGGHEAVGAIPTTTQGVVTGVTAIIVFLLVLAFLNLKVWPIITKGLDERAQKIRSEIESAEAARAQARAALESYEKSLAQARAEAQKMLDQAKSQQQAIAADLRAKADAELTTLKEKAMRDIESAKRTALHEIYAEAANLATGVAGKILRREIRADDQKRLVDDCLSEMSAASRR
ncbi:MAG: F0F1 ATP synthase subunit B [Phycisphaerae bacterium]|nr:F0F1 ATP synthase subunit B [Phycisphaerae bacterium]